MIVLGLDTTNRRGSLALARDGRVVAVRAGDAQLTHGERLPGEIAALLDEQGLASGEVDAYGLAVGPGSFTGLRVGIATIQALAMVHARPVVPVSTLVAATHAAVAGGGRPAPGHLVGAWIDAQRGEVFSALYRIAVDPPPPSEAAYAAGEGAPPGLEAVASHRVDTPHATLRRWRRDGHQDIWIVGDGAARHASVIASSPGVRLGPEPAHLAEAIACLATLWVDRCAISPHALRPLYVRRSDAELARDRTG